MRDLYWFRLGLALDCFLNVAVFDGRLGETISLHAADDAVAGRRWACILCRVLSTLVERDHCTKTRAGVATTLLGGLRAVGLLTLLFVAVIAAIEGGAAALWHLVT